MEPPFCTNGNAGYLMQLSVKKCMFACTGTTEWIHVWRNNEGMNKKGKEGLLHE